MQQPLDANSQSHASAILLQEINNFLGFSSANNSSKESRPQKQQIGAVQKKLNKLSRSENFYEMAFDAIINRDLEYDQLVLVTLLLKEKFQVHFEQIDESNIEKLETLIKMIVKKYAVNPPFTFTTNVCICMICLYLKRAEQLQKSLQHEGMVKYFASFLEGGVSSDYLYRAIEFAPEECQSSRIVMDESKKDSVRGYLRYSQFAVLHHLNSVSAELWQKNVVKKGSLFSALKNWLDVGFNKELYEELPNHFLAQRLFEFALESDFSAEASDCLLIIIKRIKRAESGDPLYQLLVNGIFKLVHSVDSHLRHNPDTCDISIETIEVICDFGLLSSELFIANFSPEVESFLKSTIGYLQVKDLEDAFPSIVDFWQCFIKDVQSMKALQSNSGTSLKELIKSVYAAVCFRTKWDMKMIAHLNQISQSKLGDFYKEAEFIIECRDQAEDFFLAIALAFGKLNYIDFVIECINNLPKEESEVFWPYLEVFLFSLSEASKKLPQITEGLKKLVMSYSSTQSMQELCAVRNAYLVVFRSLMSIREGNLPMRDEFVQHIFGLVAANFESGLTRYYAHKAFSKGCEEHPQIIASNIDNFLGLLLQYDCREEIVRGLMHVVVSDGQVLQKSLPKILEIQYTLFKNSANDVLKRKEVYHSIYSVLKILALYQQKEHYTETLVQFTSTIWPLITHYLKEPRMREFDEDPEVERAVKLCKFLMRALKAQFVPLIESLFQSVLQAYKTHPICSYIYILEVAITVYYDNQSLYEYFKALYGEFCQVTYGHLQVKDSIADNQLLIDDFIGMNKRFFIFNSRIVLESGQIPMLINTCINLCHVLDIPKVSKAAYQFFETIFMVYWAEKFIAQFNEQNARAQSGDDFQKNPANEHLYQQLKSYVLPKVPEILQKMIDHLRDVPLESTTECLMDALLSEVKAFPTQNPDIWGDILAKIPAELLTMSEKRDIFDNLPKVGSQLEEQSDQSVKRIDRLIYRLNKRCITLSRSQF